MEIWRPCENITVDDDSNSTAILEDAAGALANLTEFPVLSKQLEEVVDIVNRVLNLEPSFLAENSNTTRVILQDFEHILTDMVLESGQNSAQVESASLSALVANVINENNAVVYSFLSEDGLSSQQIQLDKPDVDVDFDNRTEVGVALFSSLTVNEQRVAFTVFANDKAFPSKPGDRYVIKTRVVNVILNGSSSQLPLGQIVEIRFKSDSSSPRNNKRCVFWDFGIDAWSTEGCFLNLSATKGELDICRCTHLTHFAMQVTANPRYISAANQLALDIISFMGCALSLIGLACIAKTAIAHPIWRQDLSNKILLHMSAALTLNIVAFLLVALWHVADASVSCVFLGVVLHYSLLTCFCWMLVLSLLQLMRILTMIGARGVSNLLRKVAVFAWGAPLVPVIVLLAWDPHFYTVDSTERGFCYPADAAFYATVFAPIAFIITANIVIFIILFSRIFSLCCWKDVNKLQRHGISNQTITVRRLRTTLFIFFLFGLPWTFGLFVAYGIAFTYLFTITATLQGFLLFVFLLLFENKASFRWKMFPHKQSFKINCSSAVATSTGSDSTLMSFPASR